MVWDNGIVAIGMLGEKFVPAETSHVYDNVTLRFDNIVSLSDDFICIMREEVMPCVDETRSSGTKKTNSFFQEPDDVGIVARPAYCFFRPLEMYNVIRRVRFPEIFCGTSNVNTSHPDRIAQDGYE